MRPPKQSIKQIMKNKNNKSHCFHFGVYPLSFRFSSGRPIVHIPQELYWMKLVYNMHNAHYEISLNKGINMMCAIWHFNVIGENVRKMTKNKHLKIHICEANNISSFQA